MKKSKVLAFKILFLASPFIVNAQWNLSPPNLFSTAGNVVGIGTSSPNQLLTVTGGNINVQTPNRAYMIGNSRILWHNNITSSIFVGVGTGTSGLNNTFVGFNAGNNAVATGTNNTFIGSRAGENCTAGTGNTLLGVETGGKLTAGNFNTYLGAQVANLTASGNENVAIGHDAMQSVAFSSQNVVIGGLAYISNPSIGTGNVMMGFRVSQLRTVSDNNIVIGNNANASIIGGTNLADNNILLGANTRASVANLVNAVTLGSNTRVRANNKMILGDNNMMVGIGLSNDNSQNGPQNKLEINTGLVVSEPPLAASGLRFRDLTSVSPTTPNPGLGVLGVDLNGDVIYVPGGGGSVIGNICNTNTNPLTSDWEIPLNTHNFLFGGQGTSNYNVGIGTTCTPAAKLDILEVSGTNATTALNVINKDLYGIGINVAATKGPFGVYSVASYADPVTLRTVGVYGEANYNNSVKDNYGIYGVAKNNNAGNNIGGYFDATSVVDFNTGVRAYANNGNVYNTGGEFQAISNVAGSLNKGVSTLAFGTSSNPNIALYAQVDINRPQDYAGYFDGNVYVNGPTSGTGYLMASDAMFKTNVDTITNASSIINSLKPKQFYYDTTNAYGLNFSNKKQYGLIAQEVETVLPELVGKAHQNVQKDTAGNVITMATDYKTVNYNALFGIMIKAMQEQQLKIDSLTTKLNSKDSVQDARLTALENTIAQCCSNANTRTSNNSNPKNNNSLDIELSDKEAIVLEQNVPNPFAEQTTITYNVPASVGKAQLIFFNTNGQVIQTVDIKTRGKGKVNVFASDLSSGLYNYTLVADGKVIDSKKMVRE